MNCVRCSWYYAIDVIRLDSVFLHAPALSNTTMICMRKICYENKIWHIFCCSVLERSKESRYWKNPLLVSCRKFLLYFIILISWNCGLRETFFMKRNKIFKWSNSVGYRLHEQWEAIQLKGIVLEHLYVRTAHFVYEAGWSMQYIY